MNRRRGFATLCILGIVFVGVAQLSGRTKLLSKEEIEHYTKVGEHAAETVNQTFAAAEKRLRDPRTGRDLRDRVTNLETRVTYLERKLRVTNIVGEGIEVYNGGDPAKVSVSGEELRGIYESIDRERRIHGSIDRERRLRRSRRFRRFPNTVKVE